MENVSQTEQITNLIASTSSNNSSSEHHSPKIQVILRQKERGWKVNFTLINLEEYNLPVSLLELQQALEKSNDSAVVPENIHYKLPPNLPESSVSLLLTVFNFIWESEIVLLC